ncbi:protein kinase domain-containing protein [Haliangium sp.]|uniref:protein kinase domain-containing protein n=1 Tax=Haliangium sp. TaxID=2663208 RepID=UPI003D14175F
MNTQEPTVTLDGADTPPAAEPPEAELPEAELPTVTLDDADLPGAELREVRPHSAIQHAAMRANLRHKLFGAPQAPLRLGRFVLMDRLGQGGMGVVYSAYDPELDRRVALKLLRTGHHHAGIQAKDRLLREAQALARLSHPNVVPVYEVGVIDDQVFIVMEFVAGRTLRTWVTAETRTWRQILDAFRQAGKGLAAAHAVGLVHRDFKPDNVQVGDDGRIRVLDFGLARGHDQRSAELGPGGHPGSLFDSAERVSPTASTADPAPSSRPAADIDGPLAALGDADASRPNQRLNTPLTVTGAVLGTPAYMPPEQFVGAQVGPGSDQFSFCVSLYEALYGQRPFAGETVRELRDSIDAGEIRPPPRTSRVPRWVWPVLCRGLSDDPRDRYPSMQALLTALGRDRARARMRVALAVLAVGLVAVSAYAIMLARAAPADLCEGAALELSDSWSPDHRAALERAFQATGRPYAALAWTRVAAGLDAYAAAWTGMHEDACRAHQRGEQSGALLDKRMACLARRESALANAVGVLRELDAESLPHSVDVVQKLPPVAPCGDLAALDAEVPPPQDPAVAQAVRALRERLSRAVALEDAGRYGEALPLATTLADEAERLGYRPAWAEVLLAQGRIAVAMGDGKQALSALRQATALGLATGTYEVALEALARSIYAEVTSSNGPGFDPGTVLRPLYIAEALLEQVPEPSFLHTLLLNNAGVAHLAQGEREQARALFERALAVRDRGPKPAPIELTSVPSNLALVTPDPARRAELAASATQEAERALGPAHPRTLMLRYVEGTHTPDPVRARATLARACRGYGDYHPELREQRANCLYYLAALDAEGDEPTRAAEHLLEAAGLFSDTERPWRRDLARGQGLVHAGQPAPALAALAQGLRALGDEPEQWWNRQWQADGLLAKGMALLALGRRQAAVAALTQARDGYELVVRISGNMAARRGLARTQAALAEGGL